MARLARRNAAMAPGPGPTSGACHLTDGAVTETRPNAFSTEIEPRSEAKRSSAPPIRDPRGAAVLTGSDGDTLPRIDPGPRQIQRIQPTRATRRPDCEDGGGRRHDPGQVSTADMYRLVLGSTLEDRVLRIHCGCTRPAAYDFTFGADGGARRP